jgi:hypothetical protein
MTKKSQSRLERDAAEKNAQQPNQCWDDLKGIYNTCQAALTTMTSRIVDIYNTNGLAHFIENKAEIAQLLRGLRQDRKEFQDELTAIYKLHADKFGGSVESYLDRESLEIFESYRNWQAKFEAVYVPTVERLVAEVAAVGDRIVKMKAAQTNTDQEEVQA